MKMMRYTLVCSLCPFWLDSSIFSPTRYTFFEWCTNVRVASKVRWRTYHTSTCQACPVASTSAFFASRVVSDCLCNAGYVNETTLLAGSAVRSDACVCLPEFAGLSCAPCAVGLYKMTTSNTTCEDCPVTGRDDSLRELSQSVRLCGHAGLLWRFQCWLPGVCRRLLYVDDQPGQLRAVPLCRDLACL